MRERKRQWDRLRHLGGGAETDRKGKSWHRIHFHLCLSARTRYERVYNKDKHMHSYRCVFIVVNTSRRKQYNNSRQQSVKSDLPYIRKCCCHKLFKAWVTRNMFLLAVWKLNRVYFQRGHGVQPDTKVIIICRGALWGDYMYMDRLRQQWDWLGLLMCLKSIQALKVKCVISAAPSRIEIITVSWTLLTPHFPLFHQTDNPVPNACCWLRRKCTF